MTQERAPLATPLRRYSEQKQSRLSAPSMIGYKETGEIEYAADTARDHMAVMDANESPVEVQLTKN